VSQFWIGDFDFIDLSRPPGRPKERLARELRPGVKGVTFFRTGAKTEQFQLSSVRDCYDLADLQGALAAYEDSVGAGTLEMWWGGIEWGDVIVHDVVPIDGQCHKVLLGVGGCLGNLRAEDPDTPPARAILRCIWTLEYVELNEGQDLQQQVDQG
jgi:hypothetical protein